MAYEGFKKSFELIQTKENFSLFSRHRQPRGGEYYMMKETLLCPTFDTLNSWHFEDGNEKKGQIQSFYDNEFDPFSLPKASFLK